MSVSVCTTMIGARPSVRILVGAPLMLPAMSMPFPGSPSGAAAPPRLWITKPSNSCVSGCTPST